MNAVKQEHHSPTVSVCTVTHNHGQYIRQCLEGILMQKTTFPIEVIIGEDCSTDNTREIIKEIASMHPDIIKPVYHDSNVGALRNIHEFCLPKAKGKYIALCEGDDYWTDEYKLQKQVDFLDQHPECSFCFHEYNIVDHNDQLLATRKAANKVIYYNPNDIFHLRVQLVTVVFRNCLDMTLEERLRLKMTDVLLFARLASFGGAADLGFNGAIYRKHPGGIYNRLSDLQKYLQIIKGLREMKGHSIITPTQKKEIDKEILLRKKIFIIKMLRKYELVNSLRVAMA